MTTRSTVEHTLDALASSGAVDKRWVLADHDYAPTPVIQVKGGRVEWTESFQGAYAPSTGKHLDGMYLRGPYGLGPWFENGCVLYEELSVYDIAFRLPRAVLSHSSAPVEEIEKCSLEVLHRLGLHTETFPGLGWEGEGATLVVFVPIKQLPAKRFAATFRVWLASQCDLSRRPFALRDGVLPPDMVPPEPGFFHILDCCDETSVFAGLDDEDARTVWEEMPLGEWVRLDTFEALWEMYRS